MRGRRSRMGSFFLFMQLYQLRHIITPITLCFTLGMMALFFRVLPILDLPLQTVCLRPLDVLYHGRYDSLLLSPFYHLDDMHLYYNMASFMWKGIDLERMLGSVHFLLLNIVFSIASSCVSVALSYIAGNLLNDYSYLTTCSVGFSGVLFALKVLNTHYEHEDRLHRMLGFLVIPSRYVVWAELFLIQLITPNVSFVGHLAGIIVGIIYLNSPLKIIMKNVAHAMETPRHQRPSTGSFTPVTEELGRTGMEDSQQYAGATPEEAYEIPVRTEHGLVHSQSHEMKIAGNC